MMRKFMWLLSAVVLSLTIAIPVLAAAPAEGTVVEGVSVPGISLGFTRAQVEDAYGEPDSCQQSSKSLCEFPVAGGGQVFVGYRGPDGGTPSAATDDVVHSIRWYEQVGGWTTTAGVNTTLAADDPQAVVDAYPNARVTYTQWGSIYSVVAHEQGIEVIWAPNFYAGTVHVNMAIFSPRSAPAPREKLTQVTDLDLTVTKSKGQRKVIALVRVQDDRGLAAEGATVLSRWVLPDGSNLAVEDLTSGSGYAYLELPDASRGSYTLIIEEVVLDDHRFDRDNSVLSASIRVK